MMLPILQTLSDRQEKSVRELTDIVSSHFNLTEEEREILLPSRPIRKVNHRTNWAVQYLKRALLVEASRRGVYRITDRGLQLLSRNPRTLTVEDLMQYSEFAAWISASREAEEAGEVTPPSASSASSASATPEEMMEQGYGTLRKNLAADLLKAILDNSPSFFERLVKRLLEAMGYRDVKVTGRPGDRGIDGEAWQDKLRMERIVFQAKRFSQDTPVTASMLRDFVGSVQVSGANKGILITTSGFPRDAKEIIERSHKSIGLIDGEKLAELMIDHNIGVSTETVYEVKQIDTDFFLEE